MGCMYKTCPDCGANLDPGERCDCRDVQKPLVVSETLILGVDFSGGKDVSTIVVAKQKVQQK